MNSRITDRLNLLSKLSLRRISNAAQVYASYFWTRWTRKAWHRGNPISISIEPTTSCNLRCPECPSGLRSFSRPTGMLQEQLFDRLINEIGPTLTYINFYFQGEPYLNKSFLNFVQKASQKNIYTSTSTNAHYLDEDTAAQTVKSGLDRIIISIDGASQGTYQSYRVGGHLDKVLNGTKNLVAWKKKLKSRTPHIIFQFLVVKPNEHEIDQIKQLANDYDVDEVRFKSAQIYDFENGSPLIPTQEKYSRYKKNKDGSYSIKSKLENNCWRMWQGCVFTWDGRIVPCCFDKDANHNLGKFGTLDFESIWKGRAYNQFRTHILKARKEIEICKNCTEGTKVFG